MGCGSSAAHKKQLELDAREFQEEQVQSVRKLKEKEEQLSKLQEQHRALLAEKESPPASSPARPSSRGGSQSSSHRGVGFELPSPDGSVGSHAVAVAAERRVHGGDSFGASSLQAQLEDKLAENAAEHDRQRELLQLQHREEMRTLLDDRDRNLRAQLDERAQAQAEEFREATAAKLQVAESAHRTQVAEVEEAAEEEARRHVDISENSARELWRLRECLAPLRSEQEQAAQALCEARERLARENEESHLAAAHSTNLKRQLADAHDERARTDQRHLDLEAQTRALRGELLSRTEALRQREELLHERDRELAEVNSQLADLQGLFDEVNKQLQSECGRIERLQDTVALCAKQGKELQALQNMLEESHRMLAQVRDALESERAARVQTAGLLQHEQQRTQLLLDVLKHFKEKLQGLTPQMLLGQLGQLGAITSAVQAEQKAETKAEQKTTVPLPDDLFWTPTGNNAPHPAQSPPAYHQNGSVSNSLNGDRGGAASVGKPAMYFNIASPQRGSEESAAANVSGGAALARGGGTLHTSVPPAPFLLAPMPACAS